MKERKINNIKYINIYIYYIYVLSIYLKIIYIYIFFGIKNKKTESYGEEVKKRNIGVF